MVGRIIKAYNVRSIQTLTIGLSESNHPT